MKKNITGIVALALIVLMVLFCIFASGCNYSVIDAHYKFDYAIINCFDGTTIKGPIKGWKDYSDSDMVQVIFADDTVYYTHGSNVILINGE